MSLELRRRVLRHFADTGEPPELAAAELAELEAEHAVALDDAGRIAFANPFAAGPAPYRSTTRRRSYRAVCVWDALGILAALGEDGRVEARCPDCDERLELEVREGGLEPTGCVVHFLVPAARWYEDLRFT